MAEHILNLLREYLAQYGYWAVAAALLLENSGVPVPGEAVLLTASFLAFSERRLSLPYIILTGTCAATLGDNIGFLIGHYGGRPLLARYGAVLHLRASTVHRGERLFARYGAATVLVARFIAGLRVIAGPLAGVLRMHWRNFAIFNFLGAALWVTVISSIGFFFGSHWQMLMQVFRTVNLGFLVLTAFVVLVIWWRARKNVSA
jgi:membrane protein DedA with SNARE-associated domain